MIHHEKFVFIHIMKCGGTNIKRSLSGLYENGYDDKRVHNSCVANPPEDKVVVSSVRNPFSWYVSLYFYNKPPNQKLYIKMIMIMKNGVLLIVF